MRRSDRRAVEALADETLRRFGAVHVICNNAGILKSGRSWELSVDDWNTVLRINLLGVINGVRTFVHRILDTGQPGHIVNMAFPSPPVFPSRGSVPTASQSTGCSPSATPSRWSSSTQDCPSG